MDFRHRPSASAPTPPVLICIKIYQRLLRITKSVKPRAAQAVHDTIEV
jgi:hypothetical protein